MCIERDYIWRYAEYGRLTYVKLERLVMNIIMYYSVQHLQMKEKKFNFKIFFQKPKHIKAVIII